MIYIMFDFWTVKSSENDAGRKIPKLDKLLLGTTIEGQCDDFKYLSTAFVTFMFYFIFLYFFIFIFRVPGNVDVMFNIELERH